MLTDLSLIPSREILAHHPVKSPLTITRNAHVAQLPTPLDRCVRFADAVTDTHATLATRRALPLTWTGLPPAGPCQLPGAPVTEILPML
jgi:hypothetical protein